MGSFGVYVLFEMVVAPETPNLMGLLAVSRSKRTTSAAKKPGLAIEAPFLVAISRNINEKQVKTKKLTFILQKELRFSDFPKNTQVLNKLEHF